MVAWCSKPGHGTRLIPAGALTGVQFLKTPDYIQIVGFIDQTKVNIADGDYGGEMDPHGADLVCVFCLFIYLAPTVIYSDACHLFSAETQWEVLCTRPILQDLIPKSSNGLSLSFQFSSFRHSYIVFFSISFIGGNAFCLKVCDPAGLHAAQFCQHIYDRIGCAYNAPNAAHNKVFEACDAENGDYPGIYTANGVVQTYTQPPESLGPITTQPYTARVPSSSNCQTFSSAALYPSLPTATTSGVSSSSSASSGPTGSETSTDATRTAQSSTADATTLVFSGFSVIIGVALVGLFLS